jgi:hypothetical protein
VAMLYPHFQGMEPPVFPGRFTRAEVDALLGPKTKFMAGALDRTWIPLPTDSQPRTMDLSTFQSVENADLKWILHCGFRRKEGDVYLGIDDLLRREVGRS